LNTPLPASAACEVARDYAAGWDRISDRA